MKQVAVIFSAVILLFLVSCGTATQFVPSAATDYETLINGPRTAVFEALLSAAQSHNLSVDVLDRQSGFMQFKNATLSSAQLDQYCRYPFVRKDNNQPYQTFVAWDQLSILSSAGNVRGSVSLNVLLSEVSPTSTRMKMHSAWSAGNTKVSYQVTSLNVAEKELEAALRERLSGRPATPTPPALAAGTKLLNKDGTLFGTVTEVSNANVKAMLAKGGVVTLPKEQALAMMSK